MDDLIVEFLAETNESLEELDADIIILEQNPNDADLIGKIFRLMHTVKGTCGFLSLPKLEKVAHHAENVLGKFRDGDLEVTPEYVTLILESIDRIKFIVDNIQDTGVEPDADNMDLIEKLDIVYEGRDAPATEKQSEPEVVVEEEPVLKTPDLDGEIDFEPVKAESYVEAPAAAEEIIDTPQEPEPVASAPKPAPTPEPTEQPAAKKEVAAPTQTLRVNVDVLEGLMTMVSELVLTRNQLMQIARSQGDNDFATPLQRLNQVVSELQDGVMKTRMQPIGNAWNKLPRIIRDLAMELDKKIDLQMRGQDTELDRQVLELIKDPLTHMVRNSADHGIETPAERLAAGKKEMGTVILDAFHEGGHIIIQIKDDGKGLPLEKIKTKILEKGLATAEELETMGAQQINQFIFHAGFSTAEKVTSVSGRGVGMDVVRTNIEKIGGAIELKSIEGQGSTFTIKIPLTLAIVSALIVDAGGEKFAIPQLSVRELVMASAHSDNRIETIKGAPVFRLRNHLLPLVFLKDMLKLSKNKLIDKIDGTQEVIDTTNGQALDGDHAVQEQDNTHPEIENKNHYIVVTQVGAYNFGIIVDKVFDTEEIVVKPVSSILKGLELFSGNTILGDGTVIMILDPNGIARATGDIEATDNKELAAAEDTMVSTSDKKTSLLLFKAFDDTPKAVPLSLVARLEQVKMDRIENSGGQMMVQYRDELMPLKLFNENMSLDGAREKPVLVFADRGQSLGIIVDDIIDIKEVQINVQIAGDDPSLMGSAVIDGKATDVVDINHFILSNNKKWFQNHDDTAFVPGVSDSESKPKKILLVDDSPFFRNMLTPILSVAGYNVTSLESPQEALEYCEKGERYDMIISDIEMPEMNGFQFAQKVKEGTAWQDTPMVALSSHATQEDIDHGLEVGFQYYVAKFDRDILLNTISKTLMQKTKGAVA